MKAKGLLILFLVLALFVAGCGTQEAVSPEKTTSAPSLTKSFGTFKAKDFWGNKVDESIFAQSKVTMVNIWGTFCTPCSEEMPDLARLDKEIDGLQVVGIVIDAVDSNGNVIQSKYDKAMEIITSTGAKYTHLLPSPSLGECCLNGVTSIPVTIFVDHNGKIIGNAYIGSRSYQQWAAIISTLPLL